jgi:hypothetical protein
MAQQVKTITSEALEAAYRNLTPSQDGFTEDLMASNVVIPVLDLTASAEGATTPESLQQAWIFRQEILIARLLPQQRSSITLGFGMLA